MADTTDLKSVAQFGRAGSSPASGTIGTVAQRSEQATHNRLVEGSNPSGPIFNLK